ncbi:MAG: hypothetical protein ACOYD0_09750 [Candidatus Nanopelagicales bacterium]
MRFGPSKSALLLTATGLTAAALMSGCSSGSSSEATQTPSATDTAGSTSASPSPSASGTEVDFSSTLTSVYSSTDTVGADKNQVYGTNVLTGVATINNRSVRVRMLGTVDYTDGSGPLGGFLQLTWSDGTTMGMRQEGTAAFDADTKKTKFDATLEVINGSGKAGGTTGAGTWTGASTSTSGLGSSIKIKVKLNVVGAPSEFTGGPASGPTDVPTESYSATIAP